ncbi:MAG: zinc ribbon domain-containing protein [Myxococcales bacterium]|nr:zinc ribbon domain-containing protein [Myxococcales bacterium]MCB9520973.1 zinc ribbon domain-containing protein [Myxococcales bacterium]
MPIYEYRCAACGHDFDRLQRVGADAPSCPSCGATETSRRVSLGSFQLKGSGWYASDYKGSSGGAPQSAAESAAGSTASDAPSGGGSCGPGCGCH